MAVRVPPTRGAGQLTKASSGAAAPRGSGRDPSTARQPWEPPARQGASPLGGQRSEDCSQRLAVSVLRGRHHAAQSAELPQPRVVDTGGGGGGGGGRRKKLRARPTGRHRTKRDTARRLPAGQRCRKLTTAPVTQWRRAGATAPARKRAAKRAAGMEAGIARHKGNGRVPTPGNGLGGESAADQLSGSAAGRGGGRTDSPSAAA